MPYDGRSLFERLKEQKDKKEADYEETHKLSKLMFTNQSGGSMLNCSCSLCVLFLQRT